MSALPTGVDGYADPRFAPVARAFARLFARYLRTGGALAVYRHGELVVNIWTGTADAAGEIPWDADTAALTFSTTKGITALVIHRLADRGLIDYDTPVAEYWPEFADAGKHSITVRDVLAHRAGLSDLRRLLVEPGNVLDHELMEQRLAAATPDWTRGLPVYHAVTFGWLLGGLARAVTGHTMSELYRTELAQPLALSGLYLGHPGDSAPVAELIGSSLTFTGTRVGLPVTALASRIPVLSNAISAIHIPGAQNFLAGPEPRLIHSENGAATGIFTAEAIATVYAVIAGQGALADTRLLSPETASALDRFTRTSPDPHRFAPWHLGYHAFPTFGAPRAFGHLGMGGSGGWVDPDSGLAVGFVHNRMALAHLPVDMSLLSFLLPAITRAAGTGAGRRAAPAAALVS
ncbi:beta-lactamase family protein [Nocardia huaxiensis]|uniref:Beta-lactamase family protein n=1 Tax=Nocardia huaxiensis TaxID=2755382 RepID=A0A7D6Z9T0_9NOCA|nr:serine hydrolase domain-containing protein [Nocardia huaxiensis]QLY30568.1 beta-lactamase family protein [Nocardia huaxiensis]